MLIKNKKVSGMRGILLPAFPPPFFNTMSVPEKYYIVSRKIFEITEMIAVLNLFLMQ